MKTIQSIALAFAVLLSGLSYAASEEKSDEKTEAQPKEEETRDEKEPKPEADRLKKRELGDAFGRFVPSEAISSDNAVPFPVDI